MKVGDIVKLKTFPGLDPSLPGPKNSGNVGVIIKFFKKKCWRTQELGPQINWSLVDPEPHAEVMINERVMNFPVTELELV